LGDRRQRSRGNINVVNSEIDLSSEGQRSQTNAEASTNARTRSQHFLSVNPTSEIASQRTLHVQPSVQDTFHDQAEASEHLPYEQFSGTQFVPGIKPISPPFFKDCSQSTQRSAREKILDYRDRVKASNFQTWNYIKAVGSYFYDEEGISFINGHANASSGHSL
jgi:hypothetical protein